MTDRWTAAGLAEAFAARHAALAPAPETMPHVTLADRMLDEHLDYYGDASVPLPPPPAVPSPDEIRDLLHAAPLPAALAAGTFDDELRDVAERCGLPGPATAVWAEGTRRSCSSWPPTSWPPRPNGCRRSPAAGGVLVRRGAPPLLAVRTRQHPRLGRPQDRRREVRRSAAELEDAPTPVSRNAPDAYALPSPEELSQLLGLPAVTDADRAELDAPAGGLASLVDQLVATGCVFRTGDTYGLTPLGAAVMRHVLTAGHVAAPTRKPWRSGTRPRPWPPPATGPPDRRRHACRVGRAPRWHGRGMGELLDAVSAAKADEADAARTSEYFARLDVAAIPDTVLRAALTDPVTGAAAAGCCWPGGVRPRGHGPPHRPRHGARRRAGPALDRRHARPYEAPARRGRDGHPAAADTPPTTLLPAFDTAAAAWPGGAAALVDALAKADPGTSLRILDTLHAHHPDRTVADAAAHAKKTAQRASSGRRR
ncbi:hypothetical protein ACR6C2_04085 [Streptomyces sp. INA 01156]